MVVKAKIISNRHFGFSHRIIRFEVNLFIFQQTPQALNEDVIVATSLAVYAY